LKKKLSVLKKIIFDRLRCIGSSFIKISLFINENNARVI